MTSARNIRGGREVWISAQAAVIATSFAFLLAGTNAVNPLLPVYRDQLGLDPLLLSLTFVSYVSVLVLVLALLADSRYTRHAPALILSALAIAIGSDVLLAHAHEWSILLGRAASGVAGGLGTGAASALVVAAIGARGRALAATGNLVGAVLGTAGAQIIVSLDAARSPQLVTWGHAAIMFVLLVAASLVLAKRRQNNRVLLRVSAATRERVRVDAFTVRMLATGCVGWVAVSVALVFSATVFADLGQPLVRAVGPALMLVTSAAAQLASPAITRLAPWGSGLIVLAVGASGIVVGAAIRGDALALTGFALLGVGIGVSYRSALVTLTRGAPPAQQGSMSSLFAAVTYGAAAVAVLTVGWVGNITGPIPATLGALVVAGLSALAAVAWAPQLRDTRESVKAGEVLSRSAPC